MSGVSGIVTCSRLSHSGICLDTVNDWNYLGD